MAHCKKVSNVQQKLLMIRYSIQMILTYKFTAFFIGLTTRNFQHPIQFQFVQLYRFCHLLRFFLSPSDFNIEYVSTIVPIQKVRELDKFVGLIFCLIPTLHMFQPDPHVLILGFLGNNNIGFFIQLYTSFIDWKEMWENVMMMSKILVELLLLRNVTLQNWFVVTCCQFGSLATHLHPV